MLASTSGLERNSMLATLQSRAQAPFSQKRILIIQYDKIDHLRVNLQSGLTCFRRTGDESRPARMVGAGVQTRESPNDTAPSGIA
jgi:hypothetical protein